MLNLRFVRNTTSQHFVVVVVFFFFSVLASFAQPIFISGIAHEQPNQLVRVIVYADQFSRLEKTIAETKTDVSGNFQMELEVDETDYAFLAIGIKKGEFYLKPGAKYKFDIPKDTASSTGSIFDELPLQFVLQADDQGLNRAIGDFNLRYNELIYRNASAIYQGRGNQLVADFKKRSEMQFIRIKDPYFKDYMKYGLASLARIGSRNDQKVLEEYFIDQPVLYNNIQYTEFFSEFIKGYLGGSDEFSYYDIVEAIDSNNAISAIDQLLKRDTILAKDPQLRSLSALLLLARKSHNPDLPEGKVLGLISQIHRNHENPKISEIAGNYFVKLQILTKGTAAPIFELPDAENNSYRIKQAEGKFILLSFIRPDCRICLLQMEQMGELQEKFNSKLQNVTIVYGPGYRDVVEYADLRLYDWPILELKEGILLLEEYQIRTYPTYTIINPDGTIAMTPAPMPDENLELYLIRMMVQYDKNHPKE